MIGPLSAIPGLFLAGFPFPWTPRFQPVSLLFAFCLATAPTDNPDDDFHWTPKNIRQNAPDTEVPAPKDKRFARVDGYKCIWFTHGNFEYVPKYYGGLGTYTANHQPMEVFAP